MPAEALQQLQLVESAKTKSFTFSLRLLYENGSTCEATCTMSPIQLSSSPLLSYNYKTFVFSFLLITFQHKKICTVFLKKRGESNQIHHVLLNENEPLLIVVNCDWKGLSRALKCSASIISYLWQYHLMKGCSYGALPMWANNKSNTHTHIQIYLLVGTKVKSVNPYISPEIWICGCRRESTYILCTRYNNKSSIFLHTTIVVEKFQWWSVRKICITSVCSQVRFMCLLQS